jgi:tRNA pseudouridine38/39 synthase
VKKAKDTSSGGSGGGSTTSASTVVEEIDYIDRLNRLLPADIRITAWTPCLPEFNARFSARRRTYKYYFVVDKLNVQRMQEAAALFIGAHDFRNFCKMDIANGITNYNRTILSLDVSTSTGTAAGEATNTPADSRFQVGVFTIIGHAFLWHQIRYMTSVLFMVGRGIEEPSIAGCSLPAPWILSPKNTLGFCHGFVCGRLPLFPYPSNQVNNRPGSTGTLLFPSLATK